MSQRKGLTLPEGLAVLTFLGLLGWVLLPPGFGRGHHNAYRASCQSNLKQVGVAMAQYTQDYDQCYPRVSMNDADITPERPLGWADALQPYLKSVQVFRCPSEKVQDTNDSPNGINYTDYWFNARLDGAYFTRIAQKQSVLLAGDGNDGTDATNARYSLSNLPSSWRKDEESPAHRHLGGANYAFVDGHVKWLKVTLVTHKKPNEETYSFQIR